MNRQIDIQMDRHAGRQVGCQVGRQAGWLAGWQAVWQAGRQTEIKKTDIEIHICQYDEMNKQMDGQMERNAE
jgi:hypothetical protein